MSKAAPCTCPQPYVIDHKERRGPVAIVTHHGKGCRLPSLRIYGAGLPPEEYQCRVQEAIEVAA